MMLHSNDFAQKTPLEDALRPTTSDRVKGNALLRHALRVLPLAVLGTMLEGCSLPDSPSSNFSNFPDLFSDPPGGSRSTAFDGTSSTRSSFVGTTSSDWVSYADSRSSQGVTITLADSGSSTGSGGDAAGDTFIGIENIVGSPLADTITGNNVANTLEGGRGNDALTGGAGGDILNGGRGNDTLTGGAGGDTLYGGDGLDTASYASSDVAVQITLADDGSAVWITGGDADGDILIGIENLIGSDYDDDLRGNDAVNTLIGGEGGDTLNGSGGDDTIEGGAGDDSYLDGGSGNDILRGGTGNDVLYGISGNDQLEGGTGSDRLRGGANNDTYLFNSGDGSDTIYDTSGTEKLVFVNGSSSTYSTTTSTSSSISNGFAFSKSGDDLTITARIGGSTVNSVTIDEYYDRPGSFSIVVRSMDETETQISVIDIGTQSVPFLATVNADAFSGSSGSSDWVSYQNATSRVSVSLSSSFRSGTWAVGDTFSNIENIIGSQYGDLLFGNSASNTLIGGEGDDILEGGRGNDTLEGGTGDEILEGGRGNDTLEGGTGDDWLMGGANNDTYLFNSGDDEDIIYDNDPRGTEKIVFVNGSSGTYSTTTSTDTSIAEGFVFSRSGDDLTITARIGGSTVNRVTIDDYYDRPGSFSIVVRSTDKIESTISVPSFDSEGDLIPGNGTERSPFLATANADGFSGSSASDWVSYRLASSRVTVSLSSTDRSGTWAEGDTFVSIENLIGSQYNDRLDGNSASNTLVGGEGNDRLRGGDNNDTYLFNSGDGEDTIIDTSGTEKIVFVNGSSETYSTTTTFTDASIADGFAFSRSRDDLTITARIGGNTVNTVTIDDYYGHPGGFSIVVRSTDETESTISVPSFNSEGDLIQGNGTENSPFLATASVDAFSGNSASDWVSYQLASSRVTVSLSSTDRSGTWAEGDGFSGIDNLIGSQYNDTLVGYENANILRGGAGDDTLEGRAGVDRLNGGDGDDSAGYNLSVLAVYVDLRETTQRIYFNGNSGVSNGDAIGDTLTNIENLIGSRHDDTLIGDGKANILEGGARADTLDGGAGSDTSDYVSSGTRVYVDLSKTTQRTRFDGGSRGSSNGHASGDILTNIENLSGSDYNDTLIGDSSKNILQGGEGNDRLEGAAGADRLDGGEHSSSFFRDTASYVGSGSKVYVDLSARNGVQRTHFDGGSGGVSNGDASGDTLTNIESLIGSRYDDTLIGSAGDDTLVGGEGKDRLDGGEHLSSSLFGDIISDIGDIAGYIGSGSKVYVDLSARDGVQRTHFDGGSSGDSNGNASGDTLTNIESLLGSDHDDTLIGNAQGNYFNGWDGNDTLMGGGGMDRLYGWDGNDTLMGDAGNDTLVGGAGNDTLQGGGGGDFYIFRTGDGTDTIMDTSPGNQLLFTDTSGGTYVRNSFSFAKSGDDLVITTTHTNTITIDDYASNRGFSIFIRSSTEIDIPTDLGF